MEFDHHDEEELQALRGGGTSDSLFDTYTKWDVSWEDDRNGKNENSKLHQADGDIHDGH